MCVCVCVCVCLFVRGHRNFSLMKCIKNICGFHGSCSPLRLILIYRMLHWLCLLKSDFTFIISLAFI